MESVIKAVVVYVGLLILFRLSGKRTLAEVSPFDLVLLLIISEAVQQAEHPRLAPLDNRRSSACAA